MRTISVTEFKAQCLRLLDEVALTGESLLLTKRGKPLVEVNPRSNGECRRILGVSVGDVQIVGDITGPLGEEWDVLAS